LQTGLRQGRFGAASKMTVGDGADGRFEATQRLVNQKYTSISVQSGKRVCKA